MQPIPRARLRRLGISAARSAASAIISLFALPALADTIVIDGAKIVTGAGPAIEKGRVVIVGDKITAVGADAEVPAGATVVDGKGLTVYPGLIDAYCLAGIAAPPLAPSTGAAPQVGPGGQNQPARTAQQRAQQARQGQGRGQGGAPQAAPLTWRKATEGFKPASEAIAAMRSNGYTAALFGVRGVLTPGEDVLMTLAPGDTAANLLQERAAVNVNAQSRGGGTYPGTLMGAIAYLRQSFYDGIDARNRPPAKPDPRLEALGLAAEGKIPTLVAANSENEILRALRLGSELKLKTVVLGGREAGKLASRLADAKTAVILTEDWAQASALSKAGVPFALGSNKLEMSVSEADDLRTKAIDLVAKGLSEDVVLAALTRVPAEIVGASDRLGTLAAGRPAHLVVTEGGLFSKEGKIRFVVIGGKKVDAAPVKTVGGPKPRPLAEDGVPFATITEDDADGDGR